MLDISRNGIITVNRGDSFTLDIFVNVGNPIMPIQYVLTGEDKLYFGLMEPNQPFECALIRKMYTAEDLDENDDVVMEFVPDDTEHLLPGLYYYQVKLVKESGEVNTVIDKTKFIIRD